MLIGTASITKLEACQKFFVAYFRHTSIQLAFPSDIQTRANPQTAFFLLRLSQTSVRFAQTSYSVVLNLILKGKLERKHSLYLYGVQSRLLTITLPSFCFFPKLFANYGLSGHVQKLAWRVQSVDPQTIAGRFLHGFSRTQWLNLLDRLRLGRLFR